MSRPQVFAKDHPAYRTTFLFVMFLLYTCVPTLAADAVPDFERDIAPILVGRCVECHMQPTPAGNLDLITSEGLLAGGDTGDAIDLRNPNQSELISRIESGEMPPEQQGHSQRLAPREITLLKNWIESGAAWPKKRELDLFERTTTSRAGRDWWSLQPIVRPKPPRAWPLEHPIDAFVRNRLEARNLKPAPEADKPTLLRRLYYDLIGLPPSEAEVQAFVNDESRTAWTNQIDKLLDRPQYGERWGRYWLDLVRYADTSGYERDQEKRYAYRYRDWVINAFNSDMPYRQFVTQQIAGDEIPEKTEQSLVATGFLRLGTWNDEPNDPKDYVYDRMEDMVHTTSSAFLGLTVKCARCHTHKFDPIEQDDYYRFASVFWPGPVQPRDAGFLGGPNLLEIGYDNILGWTDITTDPDPLHVLHNGERDKPMHKIVPATMSTIPQLHHKLEPPSKDAKTTGRRLQLANWITDPKNPLPARVMMNRVWLHHFGEGIVRTPNNFGFLADKPAHPELLDWLAAEFIQRGGSIKQMHRLILTSKAWKRSSLHPQSERYENADSGNRLLWRFNRRRLDAEAIRDSMLDSTGELDLFAGGESFKATVSPEAVEGLSRKSVDWQASPDVQQKRRSIYMYIKRGLLPPMMSTFDLCDATGPCGQRNITTVPTQALALMNNQFVHERARHLATNLLQSGADRPSLVKRAWSSILRRQPTDSEMRLAIEHLHSQTESFNRPPGEEKKKEQPSSTNPPTNADAKAERDVPNGQPPDVLDKSDKKDAPAKDERATIRGALCLHLRADAIKTDESGDFVYAMRDLTDNGHFAAQPDSGAQPSVLNVGFGGHATLGFDGATQYMRIKGQPLSDQAFTLFVVANDTHAGGNRELISNWQKEENTASSLFLGFANDDIIRLSDAYSFAGQISNREDPFVLVATNGPGHVSIHQNGTMLSSIPSQIDTRKLDGNWVLGRQGDQSTDYWKGQIAEIRLYNRALLANERQAIEKELSNRYKIAYDNDVSEESLEGSRSEFVASEFARSADANINAALPQPTPGDADVLALESLCLVLMNSNEFLYVD